MEENVLADFKSFPDYSRFFCRNIFNIGRCIKGRMCLNEFYNYLTSILSC